MLLCKFRAMWISNKTLADTFLLRASWLNHSEGAAYCYVLLLIFQIRSLMILGPFSGTCAELWVSCHHVIGPRVHVELRGHSYLAHVLPNCLTGTQHHESASRIVVACYQYEFNVPFFCVYVKLWADRSEFRFRQVLSSIPANMTTDNHIFC